jgi:hypothetical protein
MKRALILLPLTFFLSACTHYTPRAPAPIRVYRTVVDQELSTAAWLTKYNAMPQATADEQSAKALERNRLLNEFVYVIDTTYNRFEVEFYAGDAKGDIASDFLQLGLGGAGSIAGGERVKSILATSASLAAGGKASIDSHWLDKQTRYAIVAQMQALRSTALVPIQTGMGETLQAYSLEQGIRDCQSYFDAGSVVAALQAIASTAGAQATAAKLALDHIRH